MAKPSLLNDILFHIVFGSKGSEKLTRHLLNALLGYTGLQKIQTLEIINPALDQAYVSDKGAVLDVRTHRSATSSGQRLCKPLRLLPGATIQ